MNNAIETVFILDRSGSMDGLQKDVVGGFNAFVERQRKENPDGTVSMVLFSDTVEVRYDRADFSSIRPMTVGDYEVGGCTALYDAVGKAIDHIESVHAQMPQEKRPQKVLFVITTDGLENASRIYSGIALKNQIERVKRDRNWDFVFLGAGIDFEKAAASMGIAPCMSAPFAHSGAGICATFNAVEGLCRNLKNSGKIHDSWANGLRSGQAGREATLTDKGRRVLDSIIKRLCGKS